MRGTEIPNSVVVITGASSGIGRATAYRIARMGGNVVLTARNQEALHTVAHDCERLGGRAMAFVADVTDEDAMISIARQVIEVFGRIDVWVNNAGVMAFGRFEDIPSTVYRRVIETNLFGYINGARAVLPYFLRQGRGTLINIGSMSEKTAYPYASAYGLSKLAVSGFSRSVRMELRNMPGIHVCTVSPAGIDTPLFQHSANYFGKTVKAIEPVYSPERVARAVTGLIDNPKEEIIVGNAGKFMALLNRISPALTERLYAGQVESSHFEDRPAGPTEGNLFEPMEQYDALTGGWRSGDGESKGMRSSMGLLGVMALALGAGILVGRSMKPMPAGRGVGRRERRLPRTTPGQTPPHRDDPTMEHVVAAGSRHT